MGFKIFWTLLVVLALLGDVLPSQRVPEKQQRLDDVDNDIENVDDIDCALNNDVDNDAQKDDADDGRILSRQKRNFGGPEAINFPLVYDSVFGVKGWLASGIEVFQDILFHVTGYTIVGKTLARPNQSALESMKLDGH